MNSPVSVEHIGREEVQDAQLRVTREVDELFVLAPASNPTMALAALARQA